MQLTDVCDPAKVARDDETGCLVWQGPLRPDGYGAVCVGRRKWLAHRLAFTLANGPVAQAVEVDHTCHNRACVNVDHLRAASRTENARNVRGPRCDSRSRARGVRQLPSGRWQAYITVSGRFITLGTYATQRKAQFEANRARASAFKEFAGVLG